MAKEKELVRLALEMIQQTGGYGAISIQSREAIKEYAGIYGVDVDRLIEHFYEINCKVDNGGAPILKEIVQHFEKNNKKGMNVFDEDHTFSSNYAVPPMETLKEVLEDRKITLSTLSESSEIDYEVLVDVMEVRKKIDEDIAYKLGKALDIPSSFWLNLESNYQSTLERMKMKELEI